jgi:hypothetical protein
VRRAARDLPTCSVVQGGSKIAASGDGVFARFSSFTAFAQSMSFAPHMIALTPVCMIEECTSNPLTCTAYPTPPLWPVTAFIIDGSPTITAAAFGR